MSNRRGAGKTVNRSALADFCGVSMPTVDDWVRRGCPVVERGGRGREWKFNTADVLTWRMQCVAEEAAGKKPASMDDLRRRTLAATTEMAELDLAKAKGVVALVDEFERVQAGRFALIRSNLLNVPARAAVELLGETDESRFKRVLRSEISDALDRAAREAVVLDEDDDAGDGD